MTTKAAAQRASKKAQRDLRAFLDALPDRPRTASEEAKRQRLIQAQDRALQACWHADDTPPVPRKASDLRKELEADLRKHDPEPRPTGRSYSWRSAIHEAGHAVAFEARGVRVLSVTMHECRPEKHDAVGALCGAIAAQRIGFDDAHSPGDMAMAKAALLSDGKGELWMSGVEGEAQRLVARCWPVIGAVAAALYEYGQLTGDQVRVVIMQAVSGLQEREHHSLQDAYAQRTARRFAW